MYNNQNGYGPPQNNYQPPQNNYPPPPNNYPPPPNNYGPQEGYQPVPAQPGHPMIIHPIINPVQPTLVINERCVNLPTTWPMNPCLLTCPYCDNCGYTEVRRQMKEGSVCCMIIALIFFWSVIGFIIFLCICCSEDSYKTTHYCSRCKSALGRSSCC